MSKLSFRARALDASKPLPVYHADDITDITEFSVINRTVPQMPTGMEKEEETERHLQEVITAQQTNNSRNQVYIPTPEATIAAPHYKTLYSEVWEKPLQYIRVPGLGLEEEVPDYDLDSEDEEWLNAQTKERPLSPIHFERMMDQLEKGSGNTVLSVREAQLLLKDEEDLVLAIYDYWLAKRLRRVSKGLQRGSHLIPTVRHERRDGSSSSSNPYLAFRKRTEKMQTRKNRKNDETAYMQMLKLKRDLTKACSLAEMVKKREIIKHDVAQSHLNIFRKRFLLEDWSGNIMASLRPVATKSASSRHVSVVGEGQWDGRTVLIKMDSAEEDDIHQVGRHEVLISPNMKRKRKKKYYYVPGTPEVEATMAVSPEKAIKEKEVAAEKSDDEDIDGIFAFKRKAHVKYYHPQESLGSWPWYCGENGGDVPSELQEPRSKRYRFCHTSVSGRFIGMARRRVGRGGRSMWDRAVFSDSEEETTPTGPTQQEVGGSHPALQNDSTASSNELNDSLKCLHFLSRSPSPSSNFEFQHFHFIECPGQNGAHFQGQGPGNLTFEGFRSDTELQDKASSFSSLPTSQFALKPSSSDMECESGYLKHDILESAKSWKGLERLNSQSQFASRRTVTDHHASTPERLPSTSQVPASESKNARQQVADPRETSRTSLSVTDSKTIVLINNANSQSRGHKAQPPQTDVKQTQGSDSAKPPHASNVSSTSSSNNSSSSYKEKIHPVNGPASAPSLGRETKQKPMDVWSMNGPAENVVQMNIPLKSLQENSRISTVYATVDAALLITSQFLQKQAERKQEESTVAASEVALPKVPNASRDMQISPKVEPLPATVVDKRTIMPPRRASTNGGSYSDILHAASRRLSLTETERGIKQALAGTVMNHSSLIETTTNSLVQLGNSSEVT